MRDALFILTYLSGIHTDYVIKRPIYCKVCSLFLGLQCTVEVRSSFMNVVARLSNKNYSTALKGIVSRDEYFFVGLKNK
jgi:hypothetical protein